MQSNFCYLADYADKRSPNETQRNDEKNFDPKDRRNKYHTSYRYNDKYRDNYKYNDRDRNFRPKTSDSRYESHSRPHSRQQTSTHSDSRLASQHLSSNSSGERVNDKVWTKDGDEAQNSANHTNSVLHLDEITALKSIYDANVLTIDESLMKGRFIAEPNLMNKPYWVRYQSMKGIEEKFSIENLPPIELYFELTPLYPSRSHPKFLISCKWLTITNLEVICEKLEKLWKDCRMEILYTWFSFLQNDVLNLLSFSHELDISSIINIRPKWITKSDTKSNDFSARNQSTTLCKSSIGSRRRYSRGVHLIEFKPQLNRGDASFDKRAVCDLIGQELITHLQAYDDYKRKHNFDKSYFTCNICFSPHLGEDCVVFPCKHINCRKCVSGYFTSLVKDGTVNSLKCPETNCNTQPTPNMIRELISEDLYKRYDELMMASVIGTLSDAYYCPRKMCGNIVIAESESSLAHCSSCGFAFCKHCKFSYHGVDPCQLFRNISQRKIILTKYKEAYGNEKLELEKLYGKKQLIAALEEEATMKWIEDMSKKCPHCRAAIEKVDGCNKMSCWRCNTYFCWICLQTLSATMPYSHYNDPNSKCFNLLFQGVNFDDDFDDLFE